MATPTKGGNVPPGQDKKIQGTIVPFEGFDKAADAAALQAALDSGKSEKVLTDLLTSRDSQQRQMVRVAYQELTGRKLKDDIDAKVTCGKFRDVVLGLVDSGLEYAARCLYEAVKGMGTDEKALVDILCTRSRNVEVQAMKETFTELYKSDIETLIKEDTSEPFTSLLLTLAEGRRDEAPNAFMETQAKADAQALFAVSEGRKSGPFDDKPFMEILGTRSLIQLSLLTFKAYDKMSKKGGIEKAIEAECAGDMTDGYLALIKTAKGELVPFFTERLYKAMKGLGTDDNAVIRTLIGRSEIDLSNIKDEFKAKYGVSLIDFVKDDTSGDYCNILVRILVGGIPATA